MIMRMTILIIAVITIARGSNGRNNHSLTGKPDSQLWTSGLRARTFWEVFSLRLLGFRV